MTRELAEEDEVASYEVLVAMIERELELVAAGRIEDFEQLNDQRGALMDELLQAPPDRAMPVLERAEHMHARLAIELERTREVLLRAVSEVERAQRAAQGYKPPSNRKPRFSSSA
jgi:hypothetical protein